ncbi:MAG TPA: hypothetical protein VGC70_03815 [Burkholderiales bacterium]|jgi:hypothetical protein
MSQSPWSAYGRLPPKPDGGSKAEKQNPVSGVVQEVMRGRVQLENYLNGVMREFFEIRSGNTGYRQIIADALSPSVRPETIEERLTRLAREAEMRRGNRSPRPGAR